MIAEGTAIFNDGRSFSVDGFDAGTSITFGRDRHQFYQDQTLTQTGAGTVVYDRIDNIQGLAVVNGVAASSAFTIGEVAKRAKPSILDKRHESLENKASFSFFFFFRAHANLDHRIDL
jgi:hypothetical protein